MIRTFETCPACGGRGTRRQRDGIATRRTQPHDRCLACNGDGALPRRRLRTLVLRGVASERATVAESKIAIVGR
jgi:DnaJ-class molecular chaperone